MLACFIEWDDTGEWTDEDTFLLNKVSSSRRDKCLRYRHITDRKRSLYSALLLRMLLCDTLCCSNSKLKFMLDERGKPFLASHQGLQFSISHTSGAIAAAVGVERVGIDAEKIIEPPYTIVDTVFSPREKMRLANAAESIKANTFYEVWTKKEALLKFHGTGMMDAIQTVCTEAAEAAHEFYVWCTADIQFACCTEKGCKYNKMQKEIEWLRKKTMRQDNVR